mgnify:CR=1 FL=1
MLNEQEIRRLIAEAQQGDAVALERIFREFKPFRYNLARRFMGKGIENEDVMQEVDCAFIESVLDYDPSFNSPPKLHIVSKTSRCVLGFYRKELLHRNRFVPRGLLSEDDIYWKALMASTASRQHPSFDVDDSRVDIAVFLEKLDPFDRVVFELAFEHGFTQCEIAESLGTYRSKVQRSLATTKVRLKEFLEHF